MASCETVVHIKQKQQFSFNVAEFNMMESDTTFTWCLFQGYYTYFVTGFKSSFFLKLDFNPDLYQLMELIFLS